MGSDVIKILSDLWGPDHGWVDVVAGAMIFLWWGDRRSQAPMPGLASLTGLLVMFGPGVSVVRYATARAYGEPFDEFSQLGRHFGGIAIGIAVAVALARGVRPIFERAKIRGARRSALITDRRTDYRRIDESLPVAGKTYDPGRYYKRGQLFLGVGQDKKGLYLPWPEFGQFPHIQITGTTGVGKGVAAQVVLTQCIRAGEAVFVIDPKRDRFQPIALSEAVGAAGREFYLVDLTKRGNAIDICAGASADDVHGLCVAGLGLGETGRESDHYRLHQRTALRRLIDRVWRPGTGQTLRDLFLAASASEDVAQDKNAAGLITRLEEATSGGQLVAGLDLRAVIERGNVLYVIGGTTGEVATLQKMILVRIRQLLDGRDRAGGAARPVAVFLDELRTVLTKNILDDIAMIRDKGCHFIMANQLVSEFGGIPDVDAMWARDAIMENCRLKILYGVNNSDTANWLAESTGMIIVQEVATSTDHTAAWVEVAGHRIVREAERPQIDANSWLGLRTRPGVAVVSIDGKMEFARFCPPRVRERIIEPWQPDNSNTLVTTVKSNDLDNGGDKDADFVL